MDQTRYHAIADATQMHLLDQLEDAYEANLLEELDLHQGILTIMVGGATFLISKHAPSQQLWLASPISGGLHFSFDMDAQSWKLPDGTALYDLLRNELDQHGIKVVL